MTSAKLSQTGELFLLEQIRKNFYKKSKNILVSIGDDAAVIKPTDQYLLATTDMMVEGVHFDLRFVTPYQLGFKLISVNVSDVYAMGGEPFYFLLNIAVNRNTTRKFIDLFFDGVKDALNVYNTILVGGDLSSAIKSMSLSATLIGYARKYIKRSGAKIGDKIYVTGNLGESACGLKVLKKIKTPVLFKYKKQKKQNTPTPSLTFSPRGGGKGWGGEFEPQTLYSKILKGLSWNIVEPLVRRHLMPEARKPKNLVRVATSMIDISDGLLIDLTRLCNESRVGARVYIENIPLSYELKEAASYLGISPLKLALSGGEDYELLFTAPPGEKVRAIYIGDVIKSERLIVNKSGIEKPFSAEGYQHFGKR